MKKLITLLTALILLFTSAVLAEETFKTDEAGHPVFGNFGEARQFSQNGLVESDFYTVWRKTLLKLYMFYSFKESFANSQFITHHL